MYKAKYRFPLKNISQSILLIFFISSCTGIISEKGLETARYDENNGYCVRQYDERGCNICIFSYAKYNETWGWSCQERYCPEVNEEDANRCTKYLPTKEDLLSNIDNL